MVKVRMENAPQDYSKPAVDLIRQRFSCRTYQERHLEGNTRQRMTDYAASLQVGPLGTHTRFALVAASEGDSRALKDLGTYGFIKGAAGFLIGACDTSPHNLEDFGYLMECIILYATDLDLGTCWLGGTFIKSRFAERISRQEEESMPAVASVGYIAKKPRRLDALIRQGARADQRLPWEQLFFDGSFSLPMKVEDAGAYATPLEMVRLGPSASNRQPWRVIKEGKAWHFYLRRSKQYQESRRFVLFPMADLQRVDMGIAMCHFDLAARQFGLQGEWVLRKPALEVLSGQYEYTVSWIV